MTYSKNIEKNEISPFVRAFYYLTIVRHYSTLAGKHVL